MDTGQTRVVGARECAPRELRIRTWLELDEACPSCEGRRLNREALAVRFRGQSIAEVSAQPISAAHRFFDRQGAVHARVSLNSVPGLRPAGCAT